MNHSYLLFLINLRVKRKASQGRKQTQQEVSLDLGYGSYIAAIGAKRHQSRAHFTQTQLQWRGALAGAK